MFSGINEDNLFAKLMELEDPTFQVVQKRIASWEASKTAKKSIHQAAEARQVQGRPRRANTPAQRQIQEVKGTNAVLLQHLLVPEL